MSEKYFGIFHGLGLTLVLRNFGKHTPGKPDDVGQEYDKEEDHPLSIDDFYPPVCVDVYSSDEVSRTEHHYQTRQKSRDSGDVGEEVEAFLVRELLQEEER
jgi:hypothetical protein